MEFKDSETCKNLMRGFAGESQAINRYIFSASTAKKQNLQVIQRIFEYTADQEKAHAKIFYKHLKELCGENITVDGCYPVDLHDDVEQLLRAAQHNEYEEYDHEYTKFAEIAAAEGYKAVANSFKSIAEIEKTHGDRFGRFADFLKNGTLFKSETEETWLCLNCGHVHTGKQAAAKCPVCFHPQGYFVRKELSPYC